MLDTKKIDKKFKPDSKRVIIQPHIPKDEERIKRLIARVLSLTDENVKQVLDKVIADFSKRHKNIWEAFDSNYNRIQDYIPKDVKINDNKRLLLGAYFSMEYSVQAAAFCNPSIVMHPDQSNLESGCARFIMSFRSVGEGHISSVEFRSGCVDGNCQFNFDEASPYAQKAQEVINPVYDKYTFFLKLSEFLDRECRICKKVYDKLPDKFLLSDLVSVLNVFMGTEHQYIADKMIWLAKSNYELQFDDHLELSEKIIFPVSKNDSNGIEDARFVRFTDDDGSVTYYATYTAYNGSGILPQLLETKDFVNFKMSTLNGKYSRNKGMALFPRKINGKYVIISRVDGENLYIMTSDNIHFWNEAKLLKAPENAWEFVQIGNCGSPIETEYGWVLLTHGVGPMRQYCIGITLLDIEDPSRIVNNMTEPLIIPNEEEREGYVPNVVYSCGAIVHNDNLIIPYAMSDTCSGIVTLSVSDLFSNVEKRRDYVKST